VISLPRIGDHDARIERSRWPEYAHAPLALGELRADGSLHAL
jgi:hypothetical protein